jgi:hypothetical protein
MGWGLGRRDFARALTKHAERIAYSVFSFYNGFQWHNEFSSSTTTNKLFD